MAVTPGRISQIKNGDLDVNQVPTLSRYAHELSARILLDVGDGSSLPTCGHLGAYAGLAPITRRCGTSIPRQAPTQKRQQAAQTRVLPVRVRDPVRPAQPGLLRPERAPQVPLAAERQLGCPPART
jgi:hypothetical protein